MATEEQTEAVAIALFHFEHQGGHWDLCEDKAQWRIRASHAIQALITNFERTDQKPVADAIRFGLVPGLPTGLPDSPTTVAINDVRSGRGNATQQRVTAERLDRLEADIRRLYRIDYPYPYPEPDEQPPKVGQ